MDDDQELSETEQEVAQLVRTIGSERIDWMTPPVGLWSRIEVALDRDARPADDARDLSINPLPGPTDSRAVTPLPRRLSRRRILTALGGGIAAGIAVGALGRGVLERGGILDDGNARTLRTADLRTLTTDQRLAEAFLREQGGQLFLQILSSQPIEFAAGIVEVWLINVDGRRMVSLGVYQGAQSTRFPVAPELMEQGFTLVDLSRELLDGDNNHSGDSIVRGELR